MKTMQGGQMEIYRSSINEVKVEVRLEKDTIWLSQAQISQLFQTERSVITKHINTIFRTNELDLKSNVQKMHIAKSDKPINLYTLDTIISVGYRVNSKQATQFRIWATRVLKEHLTQGYTLNEKRLLEVKSQFKELQQTIAFIKEKSKKALLLDKKDELLELIADYSHTFILLEQYDSGSLAEGKGNEGVKPFTYKEIKKLIIELRSNLVSQNNIDVDLFGNEREKGLDAILGALYQTFGEKELYPSIEEKASHLLYLIIKDHPFSDGNKRIGSFLFIYFLHKHNYLYKKTGEKKINDNAMTALALLVAESDPKEKDLMIPLIIHLLKNE